MLTKCIHAWIISLHRYSLNTRLLLANALGATAVIFMALGEDVEALRTALMLDSVAAGRCPENLLPWGFTTRQ